MSFQRTPLRPRSSVGNFGASTPTQASSKRSNDLRRPPSRTMRPGSSMNSSNGSSSRPGSAMSTITSRSSTPSFSKPEPYTGTIMVSVRPNPFTCDPFQACPWVIQPHSNTISNVNDGSNFNFDHVFTTDTSLTNYHVYENSCSSIINNFLNNGYNGTIFAYGMTGSGKTYSMKGVDLDPGFVRLAIDDIFKKMNLDNMNKQYNLNVSYLEIYNEKIVDLLNPTFAGELKIRDDPQYGTKIMGITSPVISSQEQLLNLINKGDSNRKTSTTDFNTRSSRSHSILQIRLNTIDLTNNTERCSTLSLCDLAGSERATSSAERRKEGAYINKSLLALSTVINKLSSSTPGNNEHIPYRDSKLTRLLQPALSGSSLVLILCTIHLGSAVSSLYVSETYNTLRFAARAKDIVMNVARNKSTSFGNEEQAKLIEELNRTIENQRNEISLLKLSGSQTTSSSTMSTQNNAKLIGLEAENAILNEKLQHFNRLVDLQRTESVILKNDALNDILGSGSDTSQMMMGNLEDFYNKVTYETAEYKSYINHLENQLKLAHQKMLISGTNQTNQTNQQDMSSKEYEQVLKEQEEEIYNLKELLKDKDHIIKNLTKTSKLRRLVDSNSVNENHHESNAMISPTNDKENGGYDLRQFKISPKKLRAMNEGLNAGISFVI